jgi:hypothetical protein
MGSTPGPRGLEKLYIDIISQNLRGFHHTKEEDLLTRQLRMSEKLYVYQPIQKRKNWRSSTTQFFCFALVAL